MAGDIDRKKLWGRSGSRCAICNVELTRLDGFDAVVGDEAHIRSRQPNGPRWDPAYPTRQLDTYANLILLCKPHHKLIDDNVDVYPAEALEAIKHAHEARVRRSLSPEDPDWVDGPELHPLASGTDLAAVVTGAFAYFMGNDHRRNEEEASLIAGFLQDAQDWGEIADDVGVAGRVQAAMSLHAQNG